jgi:hypothetical protein
VATIVRVASSKMRLDRDTALAFVAFIVRQLLEDQEFAKATEAHVDRVVEIRDVTEEDCTDPECKVHNAREPA